ncbi:MAG: methyltransferase domain-containing protein [Syntrophales bacterium LBB04]|nr:methyltransferase domain-containing protein [Syntrophales bacterium LBB04]
MKEKEQVNFHAKVKQNVAENFNLSVSYYQAFEDRYRFFAALATQLAEHIDLQPNTTVLDVGCGNGISARTLNRLYSCRVLGVDLSEKMIDDGRVLCNSEQIQLIMGDGERLVDLIGSQLFDYVLYNASIFIFPDVEQTIRQAANCLRPGGKIAFSFYPFLAGPAGQDLLAEAFERLGELIPRARVITDYHQACRAVEKYCGPVIHHQWVQTLDIQFLKDFFSIPAQSVSLFPKYEYSVRWQKVNLLFDGLADRADQGSIIWRMAQATKP